MEEYWAYLEDNTVSYGNMDFLLVESNNTVLLITNPGNSERREYDLEVKRIDALYKLWVETCIPASDRWICYYARDFELRTGAAKLFAKILSAK